MCICFMVIDSFNLILSRSRALNLFISIITGSLPRRKIHCGTFYFLSRFQSVLANQSLQSSNLSGCVFLSIDWNLTTETKGERAFVMYVLHIFHTRTTGTG